MSDPCEVIGKESDSDMFPAGEGEGGGMLCNEGGSGREVRRIVMGMLG